MLRLHPVTRLFGALLMLVAVFSAAGIKALLITYVAVLALVLVTETAAEHWRFVLFVTAPLLFAMLLVWGWVVDASRVPAPHETGVEFALFSWLRIVASGGILQYLFLPLVNRPVYLKDFLNRARLGGALGTLIVASIVFLPEVRRRIGRIIDARKAQGHTVSGLRGLTELPKMLMPLVSSLLDSATKRAELWSHRGILQRDETVGLDIDYSTSQSVLALLALSAVCVVVVYA